jgi:hypothetical protein
MGAPPGSDHDGRAGAAGPIQSSVASVSHVVCTRGEPEREVVPRTDLLPGDRPPFPIEDGCKAAALEPPHALWAADLADGAGEDASRCLSRRD